MTHRRKFAPAKMFIEKFESRRRRKRALKAKIRKERQAQFRKGFVHKSSVPKSFDVKPQLPTRGRKKRFKIF